MSTRFDDTWSLGETWSLIVSCTGSDDADLDPLTADWKLKTLDGTEVLALTELDGITVDDNVCTITVETTDQDDVDPGVYRHRLKVTDSGGAISRQVHGMIRVLSDEP